MCLLSSLNIFRNLGHYISYEGMYAILADVYHLQRSTKAQIYLFGLRYVCSSLRLFQSLIVEGRKELKYRLVRALIACLRYIEMFR